MRDRADKILGPFFWLFVIAVVFIVVRQISTKILVSYQIDKFAHIVVAFCLTAFLYPFVDSLYQYHEDRIKKILSFQDDARLIRRLTFGFVLVLVLGWEVAEYSGIKPAVYYGVPGMRSGGWDYILDTTIDMFANLCGIVWCLYLIPENFSSSENPTP